MVCLSLGLSFYRCSFDPVNGGEMVQQEYVRFMKNDNHRPKPATAWSFRWILYTVAVHVDTREWVSTFYRVIYGHNVSSTFICKSHTSSLEWLFWLNIDHISEFLLYIFFFVDKSISVCFFCVFSCGWIDDFVYDG